MMQPSMPSHGASKLLSAAHHIDTRIRKEAVSSAENLIACAFWIRLGMRLRRASRFGLRLVGKMHKADGLFSALSHGAIGEGVGRADARKGSPANSRHQTRINPPQEWPDGLFSPI